MASKPSTTTPKSDEIQHQRDGLSLCLMVNRRQRSMRIIDFRSGPHPSKRRAVMEIARREGVERVFTLVERDEVGTWTRLGFGKEGSIPGFYKRSDAWILGSGVDPEPDPDKSGLRPMPEPPDEARAEQAYQAARKVMKELEGAPRPTVKVHAVKEQDIARAVGAAASAGRALTKFEPFGRDVVKTPFTVTARGGFSLVASAESQACFDNAFLELLVSPRTEKEAQLTTSAVGQLCETLKAREVVCCFALTPVGDLPLAVAFLANGFRRTGTLWQHLVVGRRRTDAFLWTRKLAQPADS